MRKIWMNFRGCDNVEPGMPCTVIPEDEYNSPHYHYKNGLDPAFMGKSGIVIRNNKETRTIDFGNCIVGRIDKVQTGLWVPYEHVCTNDGKIIHKSYFKRFLK